METNSQKKTMFNTMVTYACSRYFRQVSGVFLAVLRPKLLGPSFYGLWTLFKIVPRYSEYLHLGARDALRFFLPYYRKRGDTKYAETITNSVFTATGVLHTILAVGLLMLCLRDGFSTQVKFGLVCMAGYMPLEFYNRHVITILRAEEKFTLIARLNYIGSFVVFALTVPLLYWFRIYGVFLSVFLVRLTISVILFTQVGLRARFSFKWQPYVEMVRKGFPIMLSDFCVELIMTSDRIIITVLLGQTDLGYYGIAVMVMAILIQLPGTAREIMEPQVMRDMDGRMSASFVEDYLLKPLVNTAYLIPFLIGPICLALPTAIPILLPKYIPAVVPTQIIALGVFFLSLAFVPRPIIVAHGWQVPIARYLPIVLIVNLTASVVFVKMGYGILGVAIGSSLSFAMLFLTLFIFLACKLKVGSPHWHRHIFALSLPFPIMCLVLFGISRTLPHFIANDILYSGAAIILFTAIMGVFHVISSRAFALLNSLALWR
jgi:O-antigen/teichoic acid export membrane protein